MEYFIFNKGSMRKNGMRLIFSFSKSFKETATRRTDKKEWIFILDTSFQKKKQVITAQTIFPPADKAAGAKLDDWLTTVFCAQKKVNLYTRNIRFF